MPGRSKIPSVRRCPQSKSAVSTTFGIHMDITSSLATCVVCSPCARQVADMCEDIMEEHDSELMSIFKSFKSTYAANDGRGRMAPGTALSALTDQICVDLVKSCREVVDIHDDVNGK